MCVFSDPKRFSCYKVPSDSALRAIQKKRDSRKFSLLVSHITYLWYSPMDSLVQENSILILSSPSKSYPIPFQPLRKRKFTVESHALIETPNNPHFRSHSTAGTSPSSLLSVSPPPQAAAAAPRGVRFLTPYSCIRASKGRPFAESWISFRSCSCSCSCF